MLLSSLPASSALWTSGSQDCFHLEVAAVSEAMCSHSRERKHKEAFTPTLANPCSTFSKHCVFGCVLGIASLEEAAVKPGMLLNPTKDLFSSSPFSLPHWMQTESSPRTIVVPTRAKLLPAGECHLLLRAPAKTVSSPECPGVGNPKAVQSRAMVSEDGGRDIADLAWEQSMLRRRSLVLMAFSPFPFQAPSNPRFWILPVGCLWILIQPPLPLYAIRFPHSS